MFAVVCSGNGDVVNCSFGIDAETFGNLDDALGTKCAFGVCAKPSACCCLLVGMTSVAYQCKPPFPQHRLDLWASEPSHTGYVRAASCHIGTRHTPR